MSKKTDIEQQQEMAPAVSPAFVEELLKNGTVILEAKTREELTELVKNIPADCKYIAGAVGHSFERDTYTLRIDILERLKL